LCYKQAELIFIKPGRYMEQDLFSLDGKVIIVTGGTGVLGSSFVNAIAEAGGDIRY
jgi:FlaA1/EpsC-like NDP-sugar epimerase